MFRPATLLAFALTLLPSRFASAAEEYEIGGPLAGVKLAPFPTQHGEEPGYPGCIPELIEQGKPVEDMGHAYREWGPQGQSPEWLLYDGSVEHWRAYMLKYLPLRSFFDRQSQRRNFVAPDLPAAEASQTETYAEPIYWVPRHDDPRPTGRFAKPVPVVRMKPGTPVLKLDLGELVRGVYAVRVIGAVEQQRLRPFREPLFMRMTVNDGLQGEPSEYRLRLGYCDQLYSVAEFYFHAPATRRYQAELAVDRGSTVDLLVHNVSLDDVLAGTLRQPIKQHTTIASLAATAKAAESPGRKPAVPLAREERLRRDAAIWNGFPPTDAQASDLRTGHGGYGATRGVRAGSADLTGEQIEQQYGRWVPPQQAGDLRKRPDWREDEVFLANPQLGLVYTFEDLRRHRPLPGPYPLKDDGAGLYFPDPNNPDAGAAWTPIGARVHDLYRDYYSNIGRSLTLYQQRGEADAAHDAALTLVRYAYAFPTLDHSEYLSNTLHDPGPFGRDASCRRRFTEANFLPHYPLYVKPIMFQYDELFDSIRHNRLLAESVGRFVPWVKTPEDVIELIDVYLVQTTAKRIMRYHYNTDVVDLANLAAVVGNREVTDPWMEWLFSRTFIYPLPVAGVQDVMISGCTREGTEVVGSTYYAQEEGAARVAASLDLYLRTGGNPKYSLSDARRYPKPVAHAYWRLENVVAGADFLRIGDVCGPDKGPGHTLRDLGFARHGWQWTRDPRFAFVLRHYVGRQDESDAEWAEVEQAAGRQPRAPWLENRSRVLPMWAGVLEAGREHDDYRFRRAAYLRLGFGMGHQHDDALDLQIVAHGVPMTIDGGQRPGYSVPGDRTTRVHNVVQVDGHPAFGHSWATALADHEGAQYLAANAAPPEGIGLMRRQIALIDVDHVAASLRDADGGAAEATGQSGNRVSERRGHVLPPDKQLPGAGLPAGVRTPNSYVFDVFRVGGGQQHTYCFHGPLNDEFAWNATNEKPPADGSAEAEYLSRFSLMPDLSRAADAPPVLEATWRMQRDVDGPGLGERELLGRNFDPNDPPKFTRLHLFGAADARALRGEFVCRQWNYHFTNLMVRTPAAEQSQPRVFAALIEPFVGEPFLIGQRELPVTDNERDARRALAIEVKTAGGHTDVCFADDRREKVRVIPDAGLKVAGEFAFYSTDADGLWQATLVGGRSLESPRVRIATEAAERRGTVTRVDYLDRALWIDAAWPPRGLAAVLEAGVPDHWTSYTATSIEPSGDGSRLKLQRGGDYFRSQITHIDASGSTVTTSLRPLVEYIDHNRRGWVASDDAGKTFWRATYLGEGRFRLEGPPLSAAAFGEAGVLRLWEYGVGDQVRQSTSVSLRRTGDRTYECLSDVSATISLPGRRATVLRAAPSRLLATSTARDGWVDIQIPPGEDAVEIVWCEE